MNKFTTLIAAVGLLFSACASTSNEQSTGLTFIHLNDTYRVGAVEDGKRGGFSRAVTLVRELQAQGRDVRVCCMVEIFCIPRSRAISGTASR